MEKTKDFFKREAVLVISFILSVISAFFVAPNVGYFDYIDYRTLSLLLCLMLVTAGLDRLNVFRLTAYKLLSVTGNVRSLSLALIALTFFSSMLITNDVALITFVPFTIVTLKLIDKADIMVILVVLETIAANLGSMLTPVGNPQNLYLFSAYNMNIGEFMSAVAPYAALSLIMAMLCAPMFSKNPVCAPESVYEKPNMLICSAYIVLFILALFTVFRVVPYYITLIITLAAVLLLDRKALIKADYSLLLTFVFLFIFIGNLGCISSVRDLLGSMVSGNELIIGIVASQVFSNVPAAILLSGFTENASALLTGVNLGGLGTLIASMASLISFKFIARENVKSSRYIAVFTIANIVFLIANLLLYVIINK